MYDNTGGMIAGMFISLILVFSLGLGVKNYKPHLPERKKYKLVKMRVIKKKPVSEQEKKVEKEETEPKHKTKKEVKKEKKKKKIKKKKIKKKKIVKKKKVVAQKPINRKEKEKKPEKKEDSKPVFGVTMSSVTSQNNTSFKVKVGNTLMTDDTTGWQNGKPEKIGKFTSDAEEAQDGEEGEEKEPPKIVKKPKPKKIFKPAYTQLAQEEEIEGRIILRLTIDENGNVIKVKVIKGLGYGLDEEAVKAAKKFKFYPAVLSNGKHKKTRITYTINFMLED